jgi:acid phosphatase
MKPVFFLLPLTVAIAGLSGCGNSSSDVPASNQNQTSGTVTGSYYEGAKVCIDQNENGRCDAGEASVVTTSGGSYSLHGSGPIVAEISTSAIRHTTLGDAGAPVAHAMVFRAPAGAPVVNAITTEVQALVDDGNDRATAEAILAARLGVSKVQLYEDHNQEGDPAIKAALQNEIDQALTRIADATAEAGAAGDVSKALLSRFALDDKIKNVVVIYAENRSFDNLFGLYPGANGIQGVNPDAVGSYVPQKDFDGSPLATLPPSWNGITAAGQTVTVTKADSTGISNAPFALDTTVGSRNATPLSVVTNDLWHRYYQNQMQINGGANDKFAAYADAGGMTMGYYDGSKMALWKIARQYTLADNFFMGAFGGSFLNHQYLICACAPQYPHADTATAHPTIAQPDSNGKLVLAASVGSSILGAPAGPVFSGDGAITPADASGMFYAVNTMQPPYQPSNNAPSSTDGTGLYADPAKPNTLPVQTQTTIGDLLDSKHVGWTWYAGAWDDTSAAATSNRVFPSNNASTPPPVAPTFQFHHQPFNYYARLDPVNYPNYRAQHLKDYNNFVADAANGTLPPVAFYKPQGNLNQHPGYANVQDGDAHIATVINKLRASPQWKNMLVIVTYDENGGFYDHAPVPKADRWGPGSRIPAIIISPYAKKGVVDHTQYDTASILRFISHRFSLAPLPGLIVRDNALVTAGGKPMGDLTNALDLSQTPQ